MPSVASRRLEPRLPPPKAYRPARRQPSRPSLAQFVVLSIVLHALFILLFGSPTGGSREGRASWGSLDVTIRGPLLESGVGREAVRPPDLRLPGSELLERRSRKREAVKAPPAAAPPEPPRAQPDLESGKVSDVSVPAPLSPIAPLTPATADLAPAPRVEPVKADVPVIAVPAIDWTPRPAAEPALSPSVEIARPAPMPVIPTTTLQESGTPALSAPLAPPVEIAPLPRPVPVIPAPALQERGLPVLAPSLAPPVEVVPLPRPPVEVPAIAAPPMPHTAIPAAAPSLAPPVDVAPIRPAAPPVATPRPGTPTARDAMPPAERPGARDSPPSSRDSPIFDNRRAPSGEAPVPGTEPRIDLDAARARAREVAREGTGNRALLPFPMPPLPEKKSKEQLAIEKAWKPDCKDAYKGMGLLAVVPLIANEFGEGNCRW